MLFHLSLFACSFNLPKGVTAGQSFTIQPVASVLPNDNSAKLTISGTFIIKDACTIDIKDLVYTPEIQQVFLYSSDKSNFNDSSALGNQVSLKQISHSAFTGTNQELTLTQSIESAKSLKLFGSQDKFVLGASTIANAGELMKFELWIMLFLCQ